MCIFTPLFASRLRLFHLYFLCTTHCNFILKFPCFELLPYCKTPPPSSFICFSSASLDTFSPCIPACIFHHFPYVAYTPPPLFPCSFCGISFQILKSCQLCVKSHVHSLQLPTKTCLKYPLMFLEASFESTLLQPSHASLGKPLHQMQSPIFCD